MLTTCQICHTEYKESLPDLCTVCGWSLSLDLIALNQGSETLKVSKIIDWAKQVWECKEMTDLKAKQAEITIVDRQNQIDDCQSRIDFLQKRLEKSVTERNKDLENAEESKKEHISQLEEKSIQLRHLFESAEVENQKIQSDLQNQLSNSQTQIQMLQEQLQHLNTEKDSTKELVYGLEAEVIQLKHLLQNIEIANQQLQSSLHSQLENCQIQTGQLQDWTRRMAEKKDRSQQLETEIGNLQHQIQTIEVDSIQLKTNQQILQAKLDTANKQMKEFIQRDRIAQAGLFQWLQSDLLDRFISEITNITDQAEALNNINYLRQKRLNQEWKNLPVHSHILQIVIDLLAKKKASQEILKDKLQAALEEYHAVILVDAILAVLAELKIMQLP
jgi:chromosome segregation ATPase